MKKLILFVFALVAYQVSATVLTVNNNPNGGTPYKLIQEAVNAALSGDTIYIQGSPTTYANFTLTDKKIIFIGTGYAPQKDLPQITKVSGFTIRNTAAVGSSNGTEFNGIWIVGTATFADYFIGSEPVNDIVIRRCRFDGQNANIYIAGNYTSATNYYFESNFFDWASVNIGSSTVPVSNFIFRNNYFIAAFDDIFKGFFTVSSILFDHNLFFSEYSIRKTFVNGRYIAFTNNIFYGIDGGGTSFSTYTNNITYKNTNSAPWDNATNVNTSGNVASQDPKFNADIELVANRSNPLLDFTVKAGPAKNTGSDGKDMGLLFDATGSLNWANARAVRLPFIFSMNITNPTIAPGVSLNVEVTAKKQN